MIMFIKTKCPGVFLFLENMARWYLGHFQNTVALQNIFCTTEQYYFMTHIIYLQENLEVMVGPHCILHVHHDFGLWC